MNQPTIIHGEPTPAPTAHAVRALLQFLAAMRYRRQVVIGCLVIAGLCGALYYLTATPYYATTGQLLVMQARPDQTTPVASGAHPLESPMPTFQSLLTSTKVIEGAIPYLRPEDCIDLADKPREQWPAAIQSLITTQSTRGMNILDVRCVSRDPRAAVGLLGAVIRSYMEFLDSTHKGSTREVLAILARERQQLAEAMAEKQARQRALRRQVGDLGIESQEMVAHPMVRRTISFNEALIEARKQRVELEASLAAIRAAVRHGDDLRQHVMAAADVVGQELLMRSLGIEPADALTISKIEQQLLDDQTRLETLQEQLGPEHPRIIAQRKRIANLTEYLHSYPERVDRRLKELPYDEVGPMLIQMIAQKLAQTAERERSLSRQFADARQQAIELNDRRAQLEILEHDLEWLRKLQTTLLEQMSDMHLKHDGNEVRTAVLHYPQRNDVPVAPSFKKVGLLSVLAALVLAVALVYVLEVLDDRFRTIEELAEQADVPALAVVRQLHASVEPGLESVATHATPNAPACESFRTLRTALALSELPTRQLVISSAEPGDGKTTIAANLGVCCAQQRRRTLLVDADLRRPGLTAMLDLRGRPGLTNLLGNSRPIDEMAEACVVSSQSPERQMVEHLDVLPVGPRASNPAELLASGRMAELLAWAAAHYDQVLIDSPPALATSDAAVLGRLVDGVMLVVQPTKNQRRTVLRAVEGLRALRIPLVGLVANRIDAEGQHADYDYGYDYAYTADESLEQHNGEPRYTTT